MRETIARIKADSAIPHTDSVRGFVYDVQAGTLREVLTADASSRNVDCAEHRALLARS